MAAASCLRCTLLTTSVVVCLALSAHAGAATLKPATAQAWDRYYLWADSKVAREIKDPQAFLIQDRLQPKNREEVLRILQSGKVYAERMSGVVPANEKFSVPDGEIHHWWGTVLVPNVKLDQLLRFLQDYDHHAGKFSDVVASKLISRDGDHFTFFFRFMRSKAFVTACFNTTQEATYYRIDSRHAWSRSAATRIAQVDNFGTPKEKELVPGADQGILWRFVSWWRFEETDQGVVVEIESASLSRDIPLFVKLIPGLSSYIRSTPKESMESVLLSIRRQFAPPK